MSWEKLADGGAGILLWIYVPLVFAISLVAVGPTTTTTMNLKQQETTQQRKSNDQNPPLRQQTITPYLPLCRHRPPSAHAHN